MPKDFLQFSEKICFSCYISFRLYHLYYLRLICERRWDIFSPLVMLTLLNFPKIGWNCRIMQICAGEKFF